MTDAADHINKLITEFNEAFEVKTDLKLQAGLIKEETSELIEAALDAAENIGTETMAHFLKEAADTIYVLSGLIKMSEDPTLVDADFEVIRGDEMLALAMLESRAVLNSAFGVFLTDKILTEAINRVHASNMTKLGDNGYPIRREDGKVMKGPNYVQADLTDLADECVARLIIAQLGSRIASGEDLDQAA